jgi:uncharacterized protein
MANRLANATSPYLLQHKDNPVDWWEWGPEAFEEARRRDVPVLLSIGYAACHWCHVMAHESFEDPDTAEEMNRQLVNVKVDREERPDVDAIYMEAVQAMTGHGGWPMTVFLDHEARPFFAGTYFPKEPRQGMPSFRQIVSAISEAWRADRNEVEEQAVRLVDAISGSIPPGTLPTVEQMEAAYSRISSLFDHANGGFGRAPKFPQQTVLDFLLRVRREQWASGADEILAGTFEAMARGGIRDHLGGGFARYAVDERWLVPHFEKMLYDNAQLARIYLWAGIELDRPDFVAVARDTLEYMARDLRGDHGGFYSSEDADSEGSEGKFYVWTLQELNDLLGDAAEGVAAYYGITAEGNFEGSNILSIVGEAEPEGLGEARRTLFEARERRERPGLDDKVVAAWNGFAIRAFAEAGAALDDDSYLRVAAEGATFIHDRLVVDGRLMRSWRQGRTSGQGFVDDHGAMALALFSLFSSTGDPRWYREGMRLVGQLSRFQRPAGGFHTTRDDGEQLIKRPFDITDNPMPSGNALASEALFYAALFTGDRELRDRTEAALAAAGALIDRYPSMVAHHLSVAHSLRSARELAIVGQGWETLAAAHYERYRPHVALAISPEPSRTVPLLEGRESAEATAWLCRGFSCDLPTSDAGTLSAQLDSGNPG